MCDFITGWGAGMVGVVVGHPMDTIKVNQQTQGIRVSQCVKEIYREFGMKGYFRGLAFPVLTNGAIHSLLFGVYRSTLELLNSTAVGVGGANTVQCLAAAAAECDQELSLNRPAVTNYWHCFVAGAAGGLAAVGVSCPVDLIKIKLQTQQAGQCSARFRTIRLLRQIWRMHGVAGFYKGNVSMIMRDTPSYGLYMVAYEFFSNWAKSQTSNEASQSVSLFVAGGVAGTLAWWAILPIDAVKSRLQADDTDTRSKRYKGIADCSRRIYLEQGVPGFFRGFWALTIRAFPVNGAIFLSLEWLNYLCRLVQEKN